MLYTRSIHKRALAALTVILYLCAAAPSASAYEFSLWPGDWFGSRNEASNIQPAIVVSFPSHVAPDQIVASFTDRRLYYVYARGRAISYPIATPRPDSRWQGVMEISDKKVDPRWTPTPEMRSENAQLPLYVPGGHPRNPLGNRALYLGSSLYRIHGTDAPWTIGQPVSRGCIRMHNRDVADLYGRVDIGTRVTVTWDSYLYG